MTRKNLLGQRFERLIVIRPAKDIIGRGAERHVYPAWHCQCDCGNMIIAKTADLLRESVKSCGCFRDDRRMKVKVGAKYNRLTALSYNGGSKWTCLCECGNIKIATARKLTEGRTKSCGCLHKEISKLNLVKAVDTVRKYDPKTASARRIWRGYCYLDGYNMHNAILTFDDFLFLSQQPCYYCGSLPQNTINVFLYYKRTQFAEDNGLFYYNGLDRIDNNNRLHIKENCVPCCIICNRAKNNRLLNDFYDYINTISIRQFNKNINLCLIQLPEDKKLIRAITSVWSANYKKNGVSLITFYSLSQLPCFYCGSQNNNTSFGKTNKLFSNYCYNGLDRIDNTKEHTIDNVVPCCKWCNFAKGKLSLSEFHDWIKRIKEFQKGKNG